MELLERMILKLIHENHGVCVLDPAGSEYSQMFGL